MIKWKCSKEVCKTIEIIRGIQCVIVVFKGPLLKKILKDSENKINKQSVHQLYAYAGHDSTLSNLLLALGVWDQQIPTYNMLALIELHENMEGKFYFKVFITQILITM